MLQNLKIRIAKRLIRALGVDALADRVDLYQRQHAAALDALRQEAQRMRSIVDRDFIITRLGRFCLFQPKSDITSQGIDGMTVDEARAITGRMIATRTPLNPDDVIRAHWTSAPHHNSIHRAMLACLPEREIDFVDVGANLADTALYVADTMVRMGRAGHVFSFEPGPVFEMARANIWLNGLAKRITISNVAASCHDGYSPMRIMAGHSPSGSIAGIDKHYDVPIGETLMVQTVKLDTFFADRDRRSLYLKIDAEGHDFAVIRGATSLIASGRVPIIHIEISPRYMSDADVGDFTQLANRYAAFNLRSLNAAGTFDQLRPIDSIPEFLDRAAGYHGWSDVILVDESVLNSPGFALLRHLSDRVDAGPRRTAGGVDVHARGVGRAVVAQKDRSSTG